MKEIWKSLQEFPAYEVSNKGSVRRRLPGKGTRVGKIIKSIRKTNRYPAVMLSINGKVTRKRVHQLVYKTFIGQLKEGYEINHKDGNKQNNLVSNLELISGADNRRHALETRLLLRCSKTGCFAKGEI